MKFKRIEVLKITKKYLLKLKFPAVLVTAVNIANAPLEMISPYLFGTLIDRFMLEYNFNGFAYIAGGLLLVYILKFIADLLNIWGSNKLYNNFTYQIRKDIWNKIYNMPYEDFESKETSDLKMRMAEDVDRLGNFLKEQVIEYVYNIIISLFSLFMIIKINPFMTAICICVIPLVFIVNKIIGQGISKINEEIRQVNEQYLEFEYDSIQMWKDIKTLNMREVVTGQFRGYRDKLAGLGMKNIRFWFFSEVFNDFKNNYLTKVMIYIIGAFYVINGSISLGLLIMYAEYFSMFFSNIDSINNKNLAFKSNRPFYSRITETFSYQMDESNKYYDVNNGGDILAIENLSFKYPESVNIIRKLNLNIKNNEHIAITGKSGVGKTTLIKLILGLYKPSEGNIRLSVKHEEMGVIMQDAVLFNMSIKENLMIANKDAGMPALEEACKKAYIYDFIMSLPDKFETVIGERGIKLSGGQKQRLIIARTMLRNPSLYIFDEATSSLDTQSEKYINDTIKDLFHTATVIYITHRPDSLKTADRIINLDE